MNKDQFKIDHKSKLPLYDQIERNLRDLIVDGHLKPGEAMPGEWELTDIFGVSRLTVRRALDELVRQNWLEKKHGVGTFVRQPTMATIAAGKLSFTEQMRSIGREPGSRYISHQVTTATDKIARTLHIEEGDPVFEITRIRLADQVPILLETACLSAVQFPALENHDWSRGESLYKLLNDEYNVNVVALDHTIKPVTLTATEARYLNAKAGIPALLSQIIAYTSDGAPVEYAWSVSNGDKSEFYFHFQRVE
ncbi:MAG TPA: GntR family transcriptional regulator [Anaerolineales bacterium]|nr:GntR family transcriptional regulator [Anaerolineales bacterium]